MVAAASMLPYGTDYLPDEVLYSYIGRSSRLNTIADPRRALQVFFGTRNSIPSADLPAHLDAFVNSVGGHGVFSSAAELVERATLYPYYRFFMSASRWRRTFDLARSDDGGKLKIGMGLVANGFGASVMLRSCDECNRLGWRRHGAVYWHRSHNLPEVQICSIHGIVLTHHFIQSDQSHRQSFQLPALPTPKNHPDSATDERLRKFALLSKEVLERPCEGPTHAGRRAAYLSALREANLIRGDSQVRWQELSKAVLAHFANFHGFPSERRLTESADGCLRWLRPLLGARIGLSHPVCHVLTIQLLFGSLSCFEQAVVAACNTDVEEATRSSDDLESWIRNTAISCRKVAAATGLSVTTVVKRRRILGIPISERRKTLSATRIASVRRALIAGASPETVAISNGVSLASVYRTLAECPEAISRRAAAKLSAAKLTNRRAWREACDSMLGRGVRAARQKSPAAYAWLYRNDAAWLHRNTPSALQANAVARVQRVEWSQRDAELAKLVLLEAKRQRAEIPRSRISQSSLTRNVYNGSSAHRHALKLPMFNAALSASAETFAQFSLRRAQR